MRSARLALALASGTLTLPAGPFAVFRPEPGDDLSPLGRARVRVVTGNRPAFDAFEAEGYAVSAEPVEAAAALVCLPRAKAAARALVAAAVAAVPQGAQVAVDGQKTDGIDAFLRELRGRVALGEALAKAHGKLAVFASPGAAAFADWAARPLHLPEGFVTSPGVFSADGIDPGSALLAAALPAKLGRRVADFGAGWGYLGRAILARVGVEELTLIEAEAEALACARENIPDPRARFVWADATRGRPGPFDAVVMNPPFHAGRAADPGLGAAFIRAAAASLTPSGTLWMVANRHLPYEATLHEAFRVVEEVAGDTRFRITRAERPQKR